MKVQAVSLSVLLGVLLLLVTANCVMAPSVLWPTPTPTLTPEVRDVPLRELFIKLPALSPDCRIYEGPVPLSYEENAGAEEALFAWFQCDDPPAEGMYAIYRFRDSHTAAKSSRVLPEWFYNAGRVTPYEVPGWMKYQSLVATQYRFGCADFQGYTGLRSRRCAAVGQYEEYITAFSFSVSPPESMADYTTLLEQMLQGIDERMAQHLGKQAE